MSFIKKKAEEFAHFEFAYYTPAASVTIKRTQKELLGILDPKDIVIFLTTILEYNEKYKDDHLKLCLSGSCGAEEEYDAISYYLGQQLYPYNIVLNEDTFTLEERKNLNQKINDQIVAIDKLLEDNGILKSGHEILFDELQELKDLMFLGKKNWGQLVSGKLSEMITSSVVGETVGRSIVESLKPVTRALLGN